MSTKQLHLVFADGELTFEATAHGLEVTIEQEHSVGDGDEDYNTTIRSSVTAPPEEITNLRAFLDKHFPVKP